MKPFQPSGFSPQPSEDPEHTLQERFSWTASAVMLAFIVILWVQGRWEKLKVGLRCCAAPIKIKDGAARQHGPTNKMKP